MSTVKISQLPFITEINANTEKTLMAGVDLPSGLTGKISMRTLAARLYSNDVLNVGINPIIYENVAAQFTDSSSVFIQTSLKNTDGFGSADYVAYANNSSGSNNFIDIIQFVSLTIKQKRINIFIYFFFIKLFTL